MIVGLILLAAFAVRSSVDDREAGAPTAASTTTTAGPLAEDLGTGTTAAVGEGLGVGTVPERDGRSPRNGFGEALIEITAPDGSVCQACVLAATDEAQRERGLMEVTDPDLGGYDGMVFEYPRAISGSFWMRNTPMPLSIAYFGEDGALVSATDMDPCGDRPDCPTHPAGAPFRFALEVPQGALADVGVVDGSRLRIVARSCPVASGG